MGLNGIICLLGLLAANACFAAERIEIVKAEGGVSVSNTAGGEAKKVGVNSVLPSANVLSTGTNGRAVVRVGSTGYVVLEKNSQIEINASNDHAGFFRQLSGMIYYAVNTIRGKDRTLEVRTKTATMGIRGTRFLVTDNDERNEIGMRKGTVSVTSLGEEFEVHRKAEQDEFEAFKQAGQDAVNKEQADFESYKESTQKEFIEYKRELTLGADRMLSFDGKRVDDRPLSAETKKDMESLESYAGEWMGKVQD